MLAVPVAAALLSLSTARAQTVYWTRSGTSIPYSSTYSGSAWSAATALPKLGAEGYWLLAAKNRSGTQTALVATDSAKAASVMYNTGSGFGARTTLTADSGLTTWRRVAVAYEQSSGDSLAVWSVPSPFNVNYQAATSGVVTSSGTVLTTGAIPEWVVLSPKPGSDEIMLMVSDDNNQLSTCAWNGSSWGSSTSFGATNPSLKESFATVYQSNNGTALAVYGVSGSTTPQYRTYASGAWSAASTMTACNGNPEWVRLAAKPGSNEVVCGILDSNQRLRMYIWTGSAWASSVEICTDTWRSDRRLFDVAYQPDGLNALVVYGQNSTALAFRTYNGTSWSAAANMTDWGGNPAQNRPSFVRVVPWLSGGEMFVVASTSSNDNLNAWRWSGTAFGSMTTLETSLGGTNTTQRFSMPAPTFRPKIASWQQVNPNP